ncbi:MAG: phosphatidate cytidylyltransferase [Rhodobacteraceae bacterium]|nr:phosphatidate cytidylyltransferase [Paracoccaceae bacterium]
MNATGKWNDLAPRVATGAGVAVLGLGALWLGGWALTYLASAVTGLMIWELVNMTAGPLRKNLSPLAALVTAAVVFTAVTNHASPFYLMFLAAPPLLTVVLAGRDRIFVLAYATAVLLTGYALVGFREGHGPQWVLWLVLVVVITDIGGYFGGRMLGGPKFWPRISPKKTWSGTISGWAGAALVGVVFAFLIGGPAWLIGLSVLIAFASQLGDIAESAIKRRTGVKDSSHVLPGHGGMLDRFDGLIGAVTFLVLWGFVLPVPQIGG